MARKTKECIESDGHQTQEIMTDTKFQRIDAKLDKLDAKLDLLSSGQAEHSIGLARVNEHLKTLNGKVARHDTDISTIWTHASQLKQCVNDHLTSSAEWTGEVNSVMNALKSTGQPSPIISTQKVAYAAGGGGFIYMLVSLLQSLL
jgi:hypothetical protein